MKKLNLCSRIMTSAAFIGGGTSAIYGLDWLLITSTILMAVGMVTAVIAAKSKAA